jgi:hypothetical protein
VLDSNSHARISGWRNFLLGYSFRASPHLAAQMSRLMRIAKRRRHGAGSALGGDLHPVIRGLVQAPCEPTARATPVGVPAVAGVTH